ncbi:unnamed protein product [Phytophthora fragariaefolia]|uniref:Unnamed protein product n=1 Tax=Phytophthora fragariaefolia TaxID=1490495 RepID=A0A9W6YFI1_9STRA|nr:unnamed protein product [Phytophthora fragariaefolia]
MRLHIIGSGFDGSFNANASFVLIRRSLIPALARAFEARDDSVVAFELDGIARTLLMHSSSLVSARTAPSVLRNEYLRISGAYKDMRNIGHVIVTGYDQFHPYRVIRRAGSMPSNSLSPRDARCVSCSSLISADLESPMNKLDAASKSSEAPSDDPK